MNSQFTLVTSQLQDPDKNVRIEAALHIGSLGDGAALPALVAQLVREPDSFVRENITWAIVRMGEAAVPLMLELLRDADPTARLQAAHALSKLGDGRAVDALVAALRDDDTQVVQKVAFALGRLEDDRAVPALVSLLGNGGAELQTTVRTALEGFGPTALPLLEQALHHQHWAVREQAATLVGSIGDSAAVPLLVNALHDDHWQVRFAVVTALGTIAGPDAREALRPALGDEDRRVRLVAARLVEQR